MSRPLKVVVYFLAWTALALFYFTQGLWQKMAQHDPTPWSDYLISWLVGMYIWAALTPLILRIGTRFPIERQKWARRVALHLALSLVFAIAQLGIEAAILPRFKVFPTLMYTFASTLVFLMIIGFHNSILMYWTVLAGQYGVRYYRRYQERQREALRLELQASELKSQLVEAQLSALKMQLQPHFLFNTLNAIMVLVRQQKAREAEETIARLSDLLRCVLEQGEGQETPLRRELEFVQLYLAIEQVRFPDRLRVEIAADPEVLDAAVPPMGLQPIVENAIRHGIGRSSAAGKLQITAVRVGDSLEIQVIDDGPGFNGSGAPSRGIGLSNTRARLHRLYGEGARLTVENGPAGGVVATMTLPYRAVPETVGTEAMEVHAVDNAYRG